MDPPSYLPPRDDADVLSIHSTAPSYTSALPPAYNDAIEAPPTVSASLPRARQTTEQLYSSLLTENYSVATWPSLTGSGHQNRAYANVAARRARRDEAARQVEEASRVVIRQMKVERRAMDTVRDDEESELTKEGKSWDHLVVQMADWKERERSWNEFRRRCEEGGKKKGRRIFGKLV